MLRTKLQARLKELAAALTALAAKESLTAEELADMEAKTAEVAEVEKQLATLDAAETAAARVAQPATDPVIDPTRTPATPKAALTTTEKVGLAVAAMAKSHLAGEGSGHRGAMKMLDEAGYGEVAQEFDAARQRTVNSGSAAGGGVLVPENMANEIIDILRPNTTFLQGGPQRKPLIGGSYKVPAAASGATAAWRGEGKPAAVSSPTFKDINMVSKFLDTLVPLTNQIIRFSLPDVRGWVEMDMSQAVGVEFDRAAYFGSGTVHQPLGITKIPGVYHKAATGGTAPTVTQIEADAAALELSMMGVNLPMIGAAWIMSPRTLLHLQNLRDGNGNRFFPELQREQPMWRNKRVFQTTQVPVTGGVTTDESELLLVAFGHVFYGEGTTITFQVSNEASYVKDGVTISAFQNDLTLIKASLEADVDLRYLEAVATLTGLRWGA